VSLCNGEASERAPAAALPNRADGAVREQKCVCVCAQWWWREVILRECGEGMPSSEAHWRVTQYSLHPVLSTAQRPQRTQDGGPFSVRGSEAMTGASPRSRARSIHSVVVSAMRDLRTTASRQMQGCSGLLDEGTVTA
jgi:hypothetical protein